MGEEGGREGGAWRVVQVLINLRLTFGVVIILVIAGGNWYRSELGEQAAYLGSSK